jgi:hypothetical protein
LELPNKLFLLSVFDLGKYVIIAEINEMEDLFNFDLFSHHLITDIKRIILKKRYIKMPRNTFIQCVFPKAARGWYSGSFGSGV